jgi:hypothetical protein
VDGGVREAGRAARPCSIERGLLRWPRTWTPRWPVGRRGQTARMSGRGVPTVRDARDWDEVRISGLDWK